MAHTPGPWVWWWDGSENLHLGTPDRGRLIVMDFVRRKIQGAIPRFAVWKGEERERMGGIMRPAGELDLGKHPDALIIQAAPLGYELAKALLLACNRDAGRELSDVTRREIEPLRLLADAVVAKAEGRPE